MVINPIMAVDTTRAMYYVDSVHAAVGNCVVL